MRWDFFSVYFVKEKQNVLIKLIFMPSLFLFKCEKTSPDPPDGMILLLNIGGKKK